MKRCGLPTIADPVAPEAHQGKIVRGGSRSTPASDNRLTYRGVSLPRFRICSFRVVRAKR